MQSEFSGSCIPSYDHWKVAAAIRATINDPSAAGVRACESASSSSAPGDVVVLVKVTAILVGSDLPVTVTVEV